MNKSNEIGHWKWNTCVAHTCRYFLMYRINICLNGPTGQIWKVASNNMWRSAGGIFCSMSSIVPSDEKTQKECFCVSNPPLKNLYVFAVFNAVPYDFIISSFSNAAFISATVFGFFGKIPFFMRCKVRKIGVISSLASWWLKHVWERVRNCQ